MQRAGDSGRDRQQGAAGRPVRCHRPPHPDPVPWDCCMPQCLQARTGASAGRPLRRPGTHVGEPDKALGAVARRDALRQARRVGQVLVEVAAKHVVVPAGLRVGRGVEACRGVGFHNCQLSASQRGGEMGGRGGPPPCSWLRDLTGDAAGLTNVEVAGIDERDAGDQGAGVCGAGASKQQASRGQQQPAGTIGETSALAMGQRHRAAQALAAGAAAPCTAAEGESEGSRSSCQRRYCMQGCIRKGSQCAGCTSTAAVRLTAAGLPPGDPTCYRCAGVIDQATEDA